MDSLGMRNYSHRSGDELESNVSYETGGGGPLGLNSLNSNDDDDPILTATITFDVTVDPNGQVISTSEGQIIAEGIHQPIDGRTLNLLEHNPIPIAQITSSQINGGSGIQADSLTSMNSGAGGGAAGHHRSKDLTILQDSLDESESDAESTSTSTESLIERSKRYMNQEAGIIILKRENSQAKNFNINLDFDLNQKHQDPTGAPTAITDEKGFNINLDFDIDNKQPKKTGVDIDLMITSSTTNSRMETRENSYEVTHPHHNPHLHQGPADVEYWRMTSGGPSKKSLDPNLIENEMSWTALHSNPPNPEYSKLISEGGSGPGYQGYHVINSSRMDPNRRSGVEQDSARLIDKIVERAVNRPNGGENYSKQLPKVGRFTLDEVLDQVLRANGHQPTNGESSSGIGIGLRSIDQVDLEGLIRGFEPEEAAEGKFVLYITEKQLLQLLKQRALIVPSITGSGQDSLNGHSKRLKGPANTDSSAGYRPSNPLGSMFEGSSVSNNNIRAAGPNGELGEQYRTTNSLSSIVEEDRRTQTSTGGSYGGGSRADNHLNSYTSNTSQRVELPPQQQSHSVYRSINSIESEQIRSSAGGVDENRLSVHNEDSFHGEHSKTSQQQRLSSASNYTQILHHDLIVLNEIENFLRRTLFHHKSQENTVDWASLRAEYVQHPDRPELMKRYVVSLLDERTRLSPSPIKIKQTSVSSSIRTGVANEEEKLKAVDEFVDSVINRKRQKEGDRSLRLLESLLEKLVERKKDEITISESEIRNLEVFVQGLRNNHPCKQPNGGNKIIIRATRKLPAKVYITGGDGRNLVRKKITYSYLDNYRPTTRVYEVANNVVYSDSKAGATSSSTGINANIPQAADLFNSKNNLNYLVKPFDAHIADSIGKPSHEQINKYLSVINTGVKNPDLIQIHPLLNNKTEIKTQPGPDLTNNYPSLKEPVLIDSSDYPKYIEDIAKHFGGLQITDFPLYVQGLEFKQSSSNASNNQKVSQSVVLTKPVRPTGEGIQTCETVSRQIVNNINNVQYVRVNNSNNQTPSVVAH